MKTGFIKLNRSTETLELLNDPNAFVLLTVIALRARRTNEFNVHNLRCGEALIGDYRKCGLTRQEYRTAARRLRVWGLAAFKPTTRGTVATLLDQRIYDINETLAEPPGNQQTTNDQPTGNHPPTTNKNEKKEKKEKKEEGTHAVAWRLAEVLLESILQKKPDLRRPNLTRWTGQMRTLLETDRREPGRIEAVIRWCRTDPFWSAAILNPASLRKQFDRLELEMARPGDSQKESLHEQIARLEREGAL
ncbi:MAG: hypothetical protein ACM3VT_01845 [Solirubrobacterales bacterium]